MIRTIAQNVFAWENDQACWALQNVVETLNNKSDVEIFSSQKCFGNKLFVWLFVIWELTRWYSELCSHTKIRRTPTGEVLFHGSSKCATCNNLESETSSPSFSLAVTKKHKGKGGRGQFDWQKAEPITSFPLETCSVCPSLCQSDLYTKLSIQHTPIKGERTRTAEGIVNTQTHCPTHLYWYKHVHSYTHTHMATAGGGKHSLIGVVTSCLSIRTLLSSLWYSIHSGPTL